MTAGTHHSRTALALLALVAVPWLAITSLTAREQSAGERTLIFSALDEAGKPVKDIKTDEILIREDGVDREIVSVKPSTETLNIMLLADTTAAVDEMLLDVRKALMAFVNQVHAVSPTAQISLMEFGQAAVTAVPFTTSGPDLEKGINRLSGKPRSASVLLEAINAASNNLAKRPESAACDRLAQHRAGRRTEPRGSEADRRVPPQVRGAVVVRVDPEGRAQEPAARRRAERLHEEHRRRPRIHRLPSAIATYLEKFADALTSQYEATYKRPATKAQTVQIAVTRPGVRLHASGFAPQ